MIPPIGATGFFKAGYIVITESLLYAFLLILFVILSEPHDIQRRKIEFEKYR